MPNQKQTWALFSATAGGEAAPGPTPLENEYSLEFDGVDDAIDIGTSSLGLTTAISVSAWVKTTATGANRIIVCEDTTSGSNRNWYLALYSSNKARFVVWNTDGTQNTLTRATASEINDGDWHHVMATYDGTTNVDGIKLYIDGVVETATAGSTGIRSTASTEPSIGSLTASVNWFWSGNIDEVSIWNSALSGADVATLYNSGLPNDLKTVLSSTPIAWWRNGDSGVFRDSQWDILDQMKIDNFSNLSTETNAISSRVDCGNDSSLDMSGGVVSISAWVNFDSLGNYEGVAGKRSLTGLPLSYVIGLDNTSKMRFIVTQSDNSYKIALSDSTANTGQWYHMLGVADGTNVKLYIDGVLQSTTDTYDGTIGTTTDSFYIGRSANDFLDGKVDDVAVFNTDKSSSASTIYNSGTPTDLFGESGLVSYWRMGEDAVYNGSHYQYPDYTKKDLFSQKSFEFDGVNEYIKVPTDSSIYPTTALSISMWVKVDALDGPIPIAGGLASGTGYTKGYAIHIVGATGLVYFRLGNGSANTLISGNVSAGVWTHILCTYDGTDMQTWVNGSTDGSTTAVSSPIVYDTTKDLFIGTRYLWGTHILTGMVDDVAIFNNDQSANVATIYNSGVPTDLSSESGLIGYWTFDDATFSTQWSIPDNSTNSNTGESVNMQDYSLRFISPTNPNRGRSENINQDGVVNTAPGNTAQGRSENMTESDRVTDVPT